MYSASAEKMSGARFFSMQRLWVEIEAHKWRFLALLVDHILSEEGRLLKSSVLYSVLLLSTELASWWKVDASKLVPKSTAGFLVAPRSLADSVHRFKQGLTQLCMDKKSEFLGKHKWQVVTFWAPRWTCNIQNDIVPKHQIKQTSSNKLKCYFKMTF